ncbi:MULTISPECIES: hypothetical protein [Enterococcus]|uniref:YokE-like PH domain-containing protein n=1 Tax=Enterococcus alishanensis TaxID=1303817 RepID=A0ABS6TB42_9ENTE|nr:hypothetical protein [Enterococcus alishanensis]MBV7390121.1 hypothetical protein [Enterococcus alishanensis]
MNTAKQLYQFTKKYQVNYNLNEEKGTALFSLFVNEFPKVDFSFAFIGFHKYYGLKKQEGLTAYGISGNTLYVLSKQKSYRYNLHQATEISGKKKINGILLTLMIRQEELPIQLGFSNGNLVLAALKQGAGK